jgi:hypothetical protein
MFGSFLKHICIFFLELEVPKFKCKNISECYLYKVHLYVLNFNYFFINYSETKKKAENIIPKKIKSMAVYLGYSSHSQKKKLYQYWFRILYISNQNIHNFDQWIFYTNNEKR